MRENKFRAWGQQTEEFRYFEIGQNPLTMMLEQPVIVEQYTGLKDKNGKEIYEGDRYRSSTGFVGTIKWNRFVSGFEPFICEDYRKYEPIEIIGNIHEGEKQ